MGKGSGGEPGEGGKGVGPNSPAIRVAGIREADLENVGRREVGWGEGDEHSRSGEVGGTGNRKKGVGVG